MKYLNNTMDKEILRSREFRAVTAETNLKRGTLLASIVIIMETALAAADIATSLLKVDERFQFHNYLFMYLIMLAVNAAFLFWAKPRTSLSDKTISQIERIELFFILYVAFMLCWGSIITLMDQKLYSSLSAFMINALICLVIYNLETRKIVLPVAASAAIVAIGLPFFQTSSDILVGHYVNLCIFLIMGWIASRIVFNSHYKQLTNTIALKRTKEELEAETKINTKNNARLKEINRYLKKLSMLDELTHLPNRRSFRYFIDYHFEKKPEKTESFSVIMIDVDHFKQLNDKHGHTAGDKVLKKIAKHIDSCINPHLDFAARWGGDEFICASFSRNAEELASLACLIREKILTLNNEGDGAFQPADISVSMGLCLLEIDSIETVSKCIENADRAMYEAKAAGRNRIQSGPGCVPLSPSGPCKP